MYEVDFGMGKPTWVCSPSRPFKNVVVMISTKDGEIGRASCRERVSSPV